MDLLVRVLIGGLAFAVTAAVIGRWSHLVLSRGSVPVAVLCLAAAARARRQAWLFASTATVIAGVGANYDWLAFVATGVTVAMVVLGRRSWILGALVGACLVQVLLRLDLDGTNGTSASVAAAIAALLILSGLRRARRSTRRRVWLGAGALAGLAVIFSGTSALAAAGANRDVRHGIDAGKGGLDAARRGDVAQATQQFDQASDAFGRARDQLDRWWVRPGLAVPVVGQQLHAARSLSSAGEELAGAASSSASELDLRGLRLQHGTIDLTAVGRADTALASARRALDRAATGVDDATSPWLLPPLVRAIDDLGARMAQARGDVATAGDVLDLAGPMLGRDGPRRWFLAVVTPVENRASGGLVGNVGEVTADGGKLDLTAVARVARLNEAVDDAAAAKVLPPIYAEAYGDWKVPAKLQNTTVAADFPTAAEALEAVQPLAGRGDVDGTISIDPLAVAALLDVVGPVTVPSWPVPIGADNAASVLLHEQYVALAGDARENFLGEVIHAVWERATTGDLPSPAALAKALGPAVRGRHIQLHSRRADEQAALGRLGADGAIRSNGGDHLGLVTDNASQSKIDWFLHRAVDYHLRYDPASGSADGTITVTLTNDAPAAGEPAYVLGGDVAPPGYSRQIVQVYTPLDLVSATVDGRPPPGPSVRSLGGPGNWAHELDVAVPPKSTLTIALHVTGHLAAPGGRLTLDLVRQSAVRPDHVTVHLDVAKGWHIAAGNLNGRETTALASRELAQFEQLWAQLNRK